MSGLDVVVGRQPIFDAELNVSGYELLHRELGEPGAAEQQRPASDLLTTDDLFVSDEVVARLTGRKTAYCSVTSEVLAGDAPIAIAPERMVIEIPREARMDDNVSTACRKLRDQGYSLALEDVMFFDASEGLLELADVVKMDVRELDEEQLPWLRDQCREAGVAMVAGHVDEPGDLDRARALGFDLFQGYLPSVYRRELEGPLDTGRLARMRLAVQLLDEEFGAEDIDEIVRTDSAMRRRLLHLARVHGPHGGDDGDAVGTVRDALDVVGWRRLQGWLALLLLTDHTSAADEVVTTALARARMAELLAGAVEPDTTGPAFMAGLLSCLEILTGSPIDQVLATLPVPDQLRQAVVEHQGPLGAVLADTIDFQLGRALQAPRTGLDELALAAASVDSLLWAVEMAAGLASTAP